jgi:S-adenosylmethionine hydrolase
VLRLCNGRAPFLRELSGGSEYHSGVNIITLTTDFGEADWFVGTMKGVILGTLPRAQIVDITHAVAAGDIRAAAFALAASYRFFPRGTVHLAVVDPGVGSSRRAIAVESRDYLFVGPDNGVLSFALAREKIRAVHPITNEGIFLQPTSNTFHGRDVFAPVAARLSKGLPIEKVGPSTEEFVKLKWPEPHRGKNSISGEIVYIDRFGNAITNIDHEAVPAPVESGCEIFMRRKRLCALKRFYQAVPRGKPVAVFGSSGLLELALNGGPAAREFRWKVGERVMVRLKRRQYSSSRE